MPELPEVETMVRGLRPALAGKVIARIEIHDPGMLHGCGVEELARRGRGVGVVGVTRRGKWVAIELADHQGLIVIQPRMTGGFWLVEPERLEHVRLTFHLENDGATIWYCDIRRLGRIHWFADATLAEAAFRKSHGPDALEIELDDLSRRLGHTKRAIKPTLMDQKVVAGIGNIYADEILFAARIHPLRMAHRLQPSELQRLHRSIGEVLRVAIAAEGSSFDAGYRTVLGLEGGFLAQNAMYGRGGQPCPECGRPILKTRIAGLIGRPTHLCPGCQPLRRRRGM